jgi:hypothetical protein
MKKLRHILGFGQKFEKNFAIFSKDSLDGEKFGAYGAIGYQ